MVCAVCQTSFFSNFLPHSCKKGKNNLYYKIGILSYKLYLIFVYDSTPNSQKSRGGGQNHVDVNTASYGRMECGKTV